MLSVFPFGMIYVYICRRPGPTGIVVKNYAIDLQYRKPYQIMKLIIFPTYLIIPFCYCPARTWASSKISASLPFLVHVSSISSPRVFEALLPTPGAMYSVGVRFFGNFLAIVLNVFRGLPTLKLKLILSYGGHNNPFSQVVPYIILRDYFSNNLSFAKYMIKSMLINFKRYIYIMTGNFIIYTFISDIFRIKFFFFIFINFMKINSVRK